MTRDLQKFKLAELSAAPIETTPGREPAEVGTSYPQASDSLQSLSRLVFMLVKGIS